MKGKKSLQETDFDLLPDAAFVRLPIVLSIFPYSKSTLYENINKNLFPRPVKLSDRIAAWNVGRLRAKAKELNIY